MLLRHLLSIAALPLVVTVLIPVWLARRYSVSIGVADSSTGILIQASGVALASIGLVLFGSSLRRFAVDGEGTLAPWDPPRRLVVHGPYRYVRNPMISGVLFLLAGEALLLLSRVHVVWALVFALVNATYIPLYEEPRLRRRFGDAYQEYCRHVPRFLPRLRPWRGSVGGDSAASRAPAAAGRK
jgi:protein-S-isoprenylcysteine O-methyltransferase Ste14